MKVKALDTKAHKRSAFSILPGTPVRMPRGKTVIFVTCFPESSKLLVLSKLCKPLSWVRSASGLGTPPLLVAGG